MRITQREFYLLLKQLKNKSGLLSSDRFEYGTQNLIRFNSNYDNSVFNHVYSNNITPAQIAKDISLKNELLLTDLSPTQEEKIKHERQILKNLNPDKYIQKINNTGFLYALNKTTSSIKLGNLISDIKDYYKLLDTFNFNLKDNLSLLNKSYYTQIKKEEESLENKQTVIRKILSSVLNLDETQKNKIISLKEDREKSINERNLVMKEYLKFLSHPVSLVFNDLNYVSDYFSEIIEPMNKETIHNNLQTFLHFAACVQYLDNIKEPNRFLVDNAFYIKDKKELVKSVIETLFTNLSSIKYTKEDKLALIHKYDEMNVASLKKYNVPDAKKDYLFNVQDLAKFTKLGKFSKDNSFILEETSSHYKFEYNPLLNRAKFIHDTLRFTRVYSYSFEKAFEDNEFKKHMESIVDLNAFKNATKIGSTSFIFQKGIIKDIHKFLNFIEKLNSTYEQSLINIGLAYPHAFKLKEAEEEILINTISNTLINEVPKNNLKNRSMSI